MNIVPTVGFDVLEYIVSGAGLANPWKARVDWALRLKDPNFAVPYDFYYFTNYGHEHLLVLIAWLIILFLPRWIAIGTSVLSEDVGTVGMIKWIVNVLVWLLVLTGLCHIYFRRQWLSVKYSLIVPDRERKSVNRQIFFTFLLMVVNSSYNLITATISHHCSQEDSAMNNWSCSIDHVEQEVVSNLELPVHTTLVTMVVPIIFCLQFQGSQLTNTLILLTISCLSLFYVAIYYKNLEVWNIVVAYIVGALLLAVFAKRHSYRTFFNHLELQGAVKTQMKEKAVVADRAHVAEMKTTIANLAHDLKTPLSSFVSGIEFALNLLTEFKDKAMTCLESSLAIHQLMELIDSVSSCLQNMHSTNDFMLMTINRIQDYSKASKGMKLVPKYETIRLLDSLTLPLRCMREIQNRITISLLPLPDDICSHIITDKQWLQENVLCLLSNAVKYSHSGEVSVKVSLVSNDNFRGTSFADKDGDSSTVQGHTDLQKIAGSVSNSGLDKIHGLMRIPSLTSRDMQNEHQPNLSSSFSAAEMSADTTYIRIDVQDEGIGLSDEVMETLFSPFKQAQRLAGGTGLGLFSLAKRIEALRGQCGVEKRADGKQGSVFWFQFPYREDASAASIRALSIFVPHSPRAKALNAKKDVGTHTTVMRNKIEPAISQMAAAFHEANGMVNVENDQSAERATWSERSNCLEILLVDDTPSILKMTSLVLKKQKHNLTTAINGADAVQKVEERYVQKDTKARQFDVVLMDLQMPVMDGLEAIKRIRAIESNREVHVPIIALSANNDQDTQQEAFASGADAFMTKPFKYDTFAQIISQMQNMAPTFSASVVSFRGSH